MATNQVSKYLKFANLQIAAESLFGFNPTDKEANLDAGARYRGGIQLDALLCRNLHASRFANASQAKLILDSWTVVEHISNTATGFSGTLFRQRKTLFSIPLKTVFVALLAFQLTACNAKHSESTKEKPFAKAASGKALFEEKCRTVAGEKIYRKVENVEGVLLLKVRPQAGEQEWSDPMWPGAAFALEAFGDSYINTFLGFEYIPEALFPPKHSPKPHYQRGYINTDRREGGIPGYEFVDVQEGISGKRFRYSGRWEEPWQYDKNYLKGYIKFFLDRVETTLPAPRYAVTFEDHVIAEERASGLASSTVRVLDTYTQEVLGEFTRYAWSPAGRSSSNVSPWLNAYKCPGHAVGASAATRKFVDQVLIPKRGEQ